jgi:hypothetical protein
VQGVLKPWVDYGQIEDVFVGIGTGIIDMPSSPVIKAGDGSSFPDFAGGSAWRWPDNTTGHAGPQSPEVTFGNSGVGLFTWGTNLFLEFSFTPASIGDFSVDAIATIDLLDATGAVLSTATITLTLSYVLATDTYTVTQAITFTGTPPQSFNQVRGALTASLTGGITGLECDSTLLFFLQQPVEI